MTDYIGIEIVHRQLGGVVDCRLVQERVSPSVGREHAPEGLGREHCSVPVAVSYAIRAPKVFWATL